MANEETGPDQTRGGEEDRWDVLVLGAGIAGLAAARALAQAGRRVLVLESTDRVGGRIRTVRTGGVPVELGAEFLHGRPPELWALIEVAGLATYERTGAMFEVRDGRLVDGGQAGGDGDAAEDPIERIEEKLKGYEGPDQPFLSWLDGEGLAPEARAAALGYVEGYNAADAREASVLALGRQQRAEDEIEGDRVWRVRDGYDRLTEFVHDRLVAAGGSVLLGRRVDAVEWKAGAVRVCAGAEEFLARQCVVALPLGVLGAGVVRWSPAPGGALEAATAMRAGKVFRMSLVLRERLWPEPMSFLFTREGQPPVWWTSHPDPAPVLTAWAGGPRAAEPLALSKAAQVEAVADTLGAALGCGREAVMDALLRVETHDWQADPNARGAYSWVPVGGLDASARMAEPVGNTLFFAGEHTDTTGHWGTVHAALGSGLRAARQALGVSGA